MHARGHPYGKRDQQKRTPPLLVDAMEWKSNLFAIEHLRSLDGPQINVVVIKIHIPTEKQ